jgi:hypothetical protein
MIYLKTAIAGIIAVVVFIILFPLIGIPIYRLATQPKPNMVVGWDPIAAARSPVTWVAIFVVFCAGGLWELRRLTK